MVKVKHKRKECIGCGVCVAIAPDHWEMSDEDGLAKLKGSETKGETDEKSLDEKDVSPNEEVAGSCPVEAIKVEKE